ncbi:hypothetical protein TBR22_A02040 [Luteitalea sp. TBR-22]|uniref:hypothetical protein n=1 Tax=Luteitalea sp. TBR-22 TaxID=2802971 RepID=UPI001AFB1F7F|nr:hypothetical protein [Luteitalea sp. TBR-22]BCS31005.1 hypothetical protein TBR22_A02040 [Luteitalea sp. TBR-22]
MAIRELAETWASVYSNSVAIRSAVSFAHFGGLICGGGAAVTADLAMLSALRRDDDAVSHEIARVHALHRFVIACLAVIVASGALLLLKDLDALLESRPFWIKMGLFVALLCNGLLIMWAESRVAARGSNGHGLLRLAAIASLILWLATTLAGTVVPNAL